VVALNIRPLVRGVTAGGICVVVAEYGDALVPEQSRQEDQAIGGYDAQQAAWNNSRQYSIFVYDLRDVTAEDFTTRLAPRKILSLYPSRQYIDIEAEDPADPRPMSQEEEDDLLSQPGTTADQKAQSPVLAEGPEGYSGWIRRNRLTVPVTVGGSHTPSFREDKVESFEDAAFGPRRTALMEKAVAPLKRAMQPYLPQLTTEIRGWLSLEKPPRLPGGETIVPRLEERIQATQSAMRARPEFVDEDKYPDIIYDPAKAEHIAYAVKKHEEKIVRAKQKGADTGLHQSRAREAGRNAAREYDADPLGVFDSPEFRGLFDKLRRK